MESFDEHEAKNQFSRLLARVRAGEEAIITQAGEPIARIVSYHAARQRVPETEKATLWVAEDFDAPLSPDLLAEFVGRT